LRLRSDQWVGIAIPTINMVDKPQRHFFTGYPVCGMMLASLLWSGPLWAESPTALAEAERAQRRVGVEEAEMLLQKGDEAYRAGDFSVAVEAYAGALDLLPVAPLTHALRRAATERYAQAAVEHGRGLVRKGDVSGAQSLMEKVLQPQVAPDDPLALAFQAQLNDPVRTNPALDGEHARHVDQVRQLLYTAQGAVDLGAFDEARTHYESVLRIDPTNTAARRGMERIAHESSRDAASAYDLTRAEVLSQVDAQWEMTSPPGPGASPGLPEGPVGDLTQASDIHDVLDQCVIPRVVLEQATLSEAVDYLRIAAKNQDPTGPSLNITLQLGPQDSERAASIRAMRFDLQLSQVPLRHVLKVVTDMTRTTFTTDGYSVVIRPLGVDNHEMMERSYRVPPDFLTSLAVGAVEASSDNDPFAESSPSSGILTARMSVQEALESQGIRFEEGAYAHYNPGTNTLRVRNTASHQDMIEQIVDTISQSEPVMVSVQVTMIRTEKHHLEELGFDWLLTPVSIGGDLVAASGTVGNTPGRRGADFVPPMPGLPLDPRSTVTNGVVTNGVRSGDYAIQQNQLNELLANPNRDSQLSSVAPGILSLTGLFTDGQAQVVMRGLSQKKGVDIMARPSVITRSGQQASVEIQREILYPTEYDPPEIPNTVGSGAGTAPATPATPTAFETRSVGVILRVLPVADADKRNVDVTLQPSFSDFDGFVNYGSPIRSVVPTLLGGGQVLEITPNAILMPVFRDQRADTQLSIADGATLVYAGLLSDSIQHVEDKVPVLGSVPYLGRLFSSESRQPVSTAILFMVRVELMDPTGRAYRDR
jgi:general secretion pathway protein D